MTLGDKLTQYVHYENTLERLLGKDYDIEEMANEYARMSVISLEDILIGCTNMFEKKVTATEYNSWMTFVNYVLNENFSLKEKYENMDKMKWILPNTDEQALLCVYDMLLSLYDEDEFKSKDLEGIIETCQLYLQNKKLPKEQWKYGEWQKENYMTYIDDNISEKKFSKEELVMFYRFVDEGCNNGNEDALSIKGYGCYGGNELFNCDWNESLRCVEKLFELTGDGIYANTLGFIHYYGRCNNGKPNYDKAFQYFSVGAFQGNSESLYKLADMFLEGKGIIQNDLAAVRIITNLYESAYEQYCTGIYDAKFADISMRMGLLLFRESEEKQDYINTFIYYLQAKQAIERRIKHSEFFGNKKVYDRIINGLEETKKKIEEYDKDFFAKEGYVDADIYFLEFIQNYDMSVKIIEETDDYCKVLLRRKNKEEQLLPINMLLVVPELEKCVLTDSLVVRFYDVKKMNLYVDKEKFVADDITLSRDSKWVFSKEDEVLFEIKSKMIRLYANDMKDSIKI